MSRAYLWSVVAVIVTLGGCSGGGAVVNSGPATEVNGGPATDETDPPTDKTDPPTEVDVWTGTMTSSSNYTVTAQDGGLVCAATWMTALKFTVATDATLTGTATTTMVGTPVCTHPEFITNPTTGMLSTITGNATDTQLQIQLTAVSNVPADSIEYAGMSASLYGIDTPPATITIPITTPGRAEGSQELQTFSGVNSYTSENAITLDCQAC